MTSILFYGDAWLQRIATLFAAALPEYNIRYVAEGRPVEQLSTDCLITTHGTAIDIGKTADLIAPRLFIDGLSSLEIHGKELLGGQYLPYDIGPKKSARFLSYLTKGTANFHLSERFSKSLGIMLAQEDTCIPICDYILENVKDIPLMSGATRPNPVLTEELACRMANRLGIKQSIFRMLPHWEKGRVAYRPPTRATLPADSERFGFNFENDRFWFISLNRLLTSSYDKDGFLKESYRGHPDDRENQELTEGFRSATTGSAKLRELQAASKNNDVGEAVRQVDLMVAQMENLSLAEKVSVLWACLRWLPQAGRREEAVSIVIQHASLIQEKESIVRKLVNTANLSKCLRTLEAARDFIRGIDVQDESLVQKIEKRYAFVKRSAKKQH